MSLRLKVITVFIYSALAVLLFFVVKWLHPPVIRAFVYPREVFINDTIHYADSTAGVSERLWEFGNGYKSVSSRGIYKFRKPGRYIVRFTGNREYKDTFLVIVKKPEYAYVKDTSIVIYAKETGMVGQNIHFKALGPGIEWCEWYFGESRRIDARDIETFHVYNSVGSYDVKLITNLNQHVPVIKTIKIEPYYKILDNMFNSDKVSGNGGGGGDDDKLKETLQEIAKGGDFNLNFNYIVKKYLCGNSHVTVVVNSKAPTDFYSYCQSLQINSDLTIDQVTSKLNVRTNCMVKLTIKQH